MAPADRADRDESPPSSLSSSLGNSEADALLREIAAAPPRRVPANVPAGARWGEAGRYVIERPLGRGGMGTVYAARDTVLSRRVAIKVIEAADTDQDAAHNTRLLREARLAASVDHDRIARIYDVGMHDGFGFVAMEYVPGGTLRQWVKGRELTTEELMDLARQIAEGLAALHESGVVHGDLKPENVLLTAQGGIKLVDFGLARYAATRAATDVPGGVGWADASGSSQLLAGGTPGYMAPEQYEGQNSDPRIDIFALGVLISELVTGRRLLREESISAAASAAASIVSLRQATSSAAQRIQGAAWVAIPERLRDHVVKMLARDPTQRFADGVHALAALRELVVEDTPAQGHASSQAKALLPSATARALARKRAAHFTSGHDPALPPRSVLVLHALRGVRARE